MKFVYRPEYLDEREAFQNYLKSKEFKGEYFEADTFFVDCSGPKAEADINPNQFNEDRVADDLDEAIQLVRDHMYGNIDASWRQRLKSAIHQTTQIIISNDEEEDRTDNDEDIHPDFKQVMRMMFKNVQGGEELEDSEVKEAQKIFKKHAELHPDYYHDEYISTPFDIFLEQEVTSSV